jgi:hypothetical protein
VDFFYKHKSLIIRVLGATMLLVGFASYFWVTPKAVVSENEIAAANVARMEAKVAGSSNSKTQAKPSSSQFAEKFQETREAQLRYLTVLAMLFGAGFLLYSFIKKEE